MEKKAFTVIEILVVVIVLAILAAIVIPPFTEMSREQQKLTEPNNTTMVEVNAITGG